jgi:hypothetical protein
MTVQPALRNARFTALSRRLFPVSFRFHLVSMVQCKYMALPCIIAARLRRLMFHSERVGVRPEDFRGRQISVALVWIPSSTRCHRLAEAAEAAGGIPDKLMLPNPNDRPSGLAQRPLIGTRLRRIPLHRVMENPTGKSGRSLTDRTSLICYCAERCAGRAHGEAARHQRHRK